MKQAMESDLKLKIELITGLSNFDKFFNNKEYYECVLSIYNIGCRIDKIRFVKLGCQYRFAFALSKMLESCYNYLIDEKNKNYLSNDIENLYKIISVLFALVRIFTNHSIKFNKEFHEAKEYKNKNYSKNVSENLVGFLVRSAIGSLVNLSTNSSQLIESNRNFLNVVVKLSKDLKQIDDCELACYIILANILEEDEFLKFLSLENLLRELIKVISKMANIISAKTKDLIRMPIEIEDKIENVCVIPMGQTLWHFVEIIESLYKIALNDSLKKDIYFNFGLKQSLTSIVNDGNNIEKKYAIKFLNQLCFDSEIAKDIYNDKKLWNLIKNPQRPSNSEFIAKNLCFTDFIIDIDQLIWTVENKCQVKDLNNEDNFEQRHIMISYNEENRDLCLRIKCELENDKHVIWIDAEKIYASNTELMKKAVEESKFVLICMNKKYQENPSCRIEADYALQLNKPIIFLNMERDFKPKGWLSRILGSNEFIDFGKNEFNECIQSLKLQISNKMIEITDSFSDITIAPIKERSENIENWSYEETDNWFREKNISYLIFQKISPCNGELLKQYYEMFLYTREFYYSSLTSNSNKIQMRDIGVFTNELKKVFEKK
ncbi:unnamed protein product [Brachionus calyciflorus]|uniref:TIR domain-containing protein n=1 Tax=Brachionus calyciflorus TaxID=104777 RepID=A0A814IYX5_9BILA|nr:unnamed protein product [Brachionus calyciflorus]